MRHVVPRRARSASRTGHYHRSGARPRGRLDPSGGPRSGGPDRHLEQRHPRLRRSRQPAIDAADQQGRAARPARIRRHRPLDGHGATGAKHLDIAAPVNAQRTGLGYFELGGRYRLFAGPSWVISAQATLRAPGVLEPVNPAAIGYTDPEVDLRALFGKSGSIGGWPVFTDLQVAQRFRVGGPPDEFRADLTFGMSPLPRWLLLAQSFNVLAEGSNPPIFPNYSYHKLQLSIVYDLTPMWSVQFGGFTTIAGHNALQENGMLLGTWYKF